MYAMHGPTGFPETPCEGRKPQRHNTWISMEPFVHRHFFEAYMYGLPGELKVLTLHDKLLFLEVCRSLFVLEPDMGVAFVNALFGDAEFSRSDEAQQAVAACLARVLEATPLSLPVLRFAATLRPQSEYARQAELMAALSFSPQDEQRLEALAHSDRSEEEVAALLATLRNNPHHLGAAVRLLEAGSRLGLMPEKWCGSVRPPRRLATAWQKQLFLHYARRGMEESALRAWTAVKDQSPGPYSLVKAAEMFDLAGERKTGIALLERALGLDGALEPARRRLAELRSPTPVDATLPGRKDVTICLFSWNKAAMLENTLRSLAASRLGRAKVRLLLNGCTDDSRSRALAAATAFKGIDFGLVELPVNVGVAPARNWLLSLPEVRQAEYVVFADDDIVLPPDWLEKLLSLAELDSRIGVVGGKAVYPPVGPERGRLQYLYRMAGLTLPGLLKLSPAEPGSGACDTGLYDFTRPCLTVMGCLILLRGDVLREVGPFDIRYSPSQVEDIDHDLAVSLAGYRVMYRGDVTVVHARNSGFVPQNPAAVWLNHLKLSCKWESRLDQLRSLSQQLLEDTPSLPCMETTSSAI